MAQERWEHLTVLREKEGYSKTAFAKLGGVSLGHLSDLESGRRNPTPAITRRFAEVLNVPISMIEKTRRVSQVA